MLGGLTMVAYSDGTTAVIGGNTQSTAPTGNNLAFGTGGITAENYTPYTGANQGAAQTSKSATGTWDQFGNILSGVAMGGITQGPESGYPVLHHGVEATFNARQMQMLFDKITSPVSGGFSGGNPSFVFAPVINAANMNETQVKHLMRSEFDNFSYELQRVMPRN